MKRNKVILSVLGFSLVLGTFETRATDPFNEEEKKFERSSDKETESSSGCSSCS